jgi:hypothetical protein
MRVTSDGLVPVVEDETGRHFAPYLADHLSS